MDSRLRGNNVLVKLDSSFCWNPTSLLSLSGACPALDAGWPDNPDVIKQPQYIGVLQNGYFLCQLKDGVIIAIPKELDFGACLPQVAQPTVAPWSIR